MAKVKFTVADIEFLYRGKRSLASFVESIFTIEAKQLLSLNYILCSDEYLLKINQAFLKHDFYTDIITFDLTDTQQAGIVGEVYISIDRIKDNAQKEHVPIKQEFLRVVFHGALHLCGYKDKKKSEITIMRGKEDYFLRLFDVK